MALRSLLARKKLDTKNEELRTLLEKKSSFEKREKELEKAIEEMGDETTEDDKKIVEDEVETLLKEKGENDASIIDLEKEVNTLEDEIKADEEKSLAPVVEETIIKERRKDINMKTRTKFFGMDIQERDAFFNNDHVKNFINEVRTCIREKRALVNVGLTIPQISLPLVTEVIEENSKLIKYVTVEQLSGTGRQTIMGGIPEAIWTEMCAKLNELELGFNNVEVDGYKVGGFFAICNAILEDNDVDLMTKLINTIGKSIAKATDKAIPYGKGTKMPFGFITRIAQTTEPADYPATSRNWKDLHTTNVLKTSSKGIELFKFIANSLKVITNDYSTENLVWIMNRNTALDLKIEAMGMNVNAAIVSSVEKTMPVVGGTIEELSFMKDGDIAFGYLDLFLLAQRRGVQLSQSEHTKFLEDQTVFKGTARYDGKPVIDEAFGIINIKNIDPTLSIDFAADLANKESEVVQAKSK